ncbi:MAG: MFS transporter [Pseudomonadota bacterium]
MRRLLCSFLNAPCETTERAVLLRQHSLVPYYLHRFGQSDSGQFRPENGLAVTSPEPIPLPLPLRRPASSAETAWCLYDWGNSAFATVCMTAVLPPYLAALANRELGVPAGTVAWGWFAALGLACGAVLAPPLGALADSRGCRRAMLALFAFLGAAATAALALVLPASWRLGGALYVVAATGFAGANAFYDGLLPGLAPPHRWDRISAKGYSWGYAGGGLVLVAAAALAMAVPTGDLGLRLAFGLVACWWAIFTIPLLLRVPEPAVSGSEGALARLRRTLAEARRQPVLWRFLLAYWLFSDGIGTVIKMAAAYGAELGLPMKGMLLAFVLTQAIGIPSTLLFARLATRVGTKRGIQLALVGYVVVVGLGYFMQRTWHFFVLAGLMGLVLGGAQALSRSFYARLVPPGREAEYFSFLDVSGRMAGVLGPDLFSLLAWLCGSGRSGVAVVALLFIAGGWLLERVPEPKVACQDPEVVCK